ncbi:hypothetical protein Bca4012_084212 [Brassica carinata]|uniref:VAN3-binding protein-like auxin canalisation domain-containing protein n=1 Tax=Brassica carinata TaxID=52824 RepID=A0A8X7V822_BRACI|nr:hypothetical protein Bca52824_026573 [Brassica carinata]
MNKPKIKESMTNQQIHFSNNMWLHLLLLSQPPPPRSSVSGKDEQMAKTDMAVASTATLAVAQRMEAAEVIRSERENLASVFRTAPSMFVLPEIS